MITSGQCLSKLGKPESYQYKLVFLDTDKWRPLIPKLPARIYCSPLIKPLLEQAFTKIVAKGIGKQLQSWDGCFNIRQKRGAQTYSLHSWAIAIDINASTNGFGQKPTMSKELVECFTSSGFSWGGTWTKPDGMHFQLAQWS